MHKILQKYMVCPKCKNELLWHITREDSLHIEEAVITCSDCDKTYFVKDRIACFLIDFQNTDDNWKRGDDFLTNYFAKHPHLKEQLLNTPIDDLNAADIYARADLMAAQGNVEEAASLNRLGRKKLENPENRKVADDQFTFLSNVFSNCTGFVLDLACGMGSLTNEILSKTSMDIMSTDISYTVLVKSQTRRKALAEFDRISYIAFDMKAIPFKNKSIPYMTTMSGLQNIVVDHGQIAKELYRVCSGVLYATCGFYSENDTTNKAALENMGIDPFWLKNRLVSIFETCGWKISCEQSVIIKEKPTPVGEIVQGYSIDAFPIVETDCESCIMVFTV